MISTYSRNKVLALITLLKLGWVARRLGQQQSWQAGEAAAMQSLGGAQGAAALLGASNPMAAPGAPAALMGPPPMGGAMVGGPMWSQQWSAPGGGAWGPMGGVPVNTNGSQPEKPIFGQNGSLPSGGSNNSTVTLLGHKVVQPRPQ